jgi:hypothetical protein
MAAAYAWIIDQDVIEKGHSNGLTGPRDLPDDLLAKLEADPKVGKKFKMYDDDGEHYYTGRILYTDEGDSEVEFAPLDDYGTPGAGCTEIRYWQDGAYRTL